MRYNIIIPALLGLIAEVIPSSSSSSSDDDHYQLIGPTKTITEVRTVTIAPTHKPIIVTKTVYTVMESLDQANNTEDFEYEGGYEEDDDDLANQNTDPSNEENDIYKSNNYTSYIEILDKIEGKDPYAIRNFLLNKNSTFDKNNLYRYNAEYFRKHYNSIKKDDFNLKSPYHLAPGYNPKTSPEERSKPQFIDGHESYNYPNSIVLPDPSDKHLEDESEYVFDRKIQVFNNDTHEFERSPTMEEYDDLTTWERILNEEKDIREKEIPEQNPIDTGNNILDEENSSTSSKGKQILEESESSDYLKNFTSFPNLSSTPTSYNGGWQRGLREGPLALFENSSSKLVATLGFSFVLSLLALMF